MYNDSIKGQLNTLEHKKFGINSSNEVYVRTETLGEFLPEGMVDFAITTQDITDVASKLPSSPLGGRRSISILNTSTNETLYWGKSNITADNVVGTTSGWEIGPLGIENILLAADIDIYAITESGKTIRVKIIEYK